MKMENHNSSFMLMHEPPESESEEVEEISEIQIRPDNIRVSKIDMVYDS